MFPKKESLTDHVEEFGEYVLSRTIKSLHRTYFLDVRATKGEDLFVTLTESRKRRSANGTPYYDRNKIVLYKEDVRRFFEAIGDVEKFLQENHPNYFEEEVESVEQESSNDSASANDLEFENL